MVNVCKKHMSHGRHDQKSSAEQFSEEMTDEQGGVDGLILEAL